MQPVGPSSPVTASARPQASAGVAASIGCWSNRVDLLEHVAACVDVQMDMHGKVSGRARAADCGSADRAVDRAGAHVAAYPAGLLRTMHQQCVKHE
jgi:hypothetical protein